MLTRALLEAHELAAGHDRYRRLLRAVLQHPDPLQPARASLYDLLTFGMLGLSRPSAGEVRVVSRFPGDSPINTPLPLAEGMLNFRVLRSPRKIRELSVENQTGEILSVRVGLPGTAAFGPRESYRWHEHVLEGRETWRESLLEVD